MDSSKWRLIEEKCNNIKEKDSLSLITVALISQTHLNINFVHNISSLGYDSIFSLFMSL